MGRARPIDSQLASIIAAHSPRAGSLIVTVFGDSVSQHGNAIWLGSLIEALAPFGLNARQIRTAVFRLVQDDWLSVVKIGRRSFYSFTESGQRRYEKSARRIYAAKSASWDGLWTVVVPAFAGASERDQLKRELSWLGYAAIANGMLAHPSANQASLEETIQELGLANKVAILHARSDALASQEVLRRLSHEVWQLELFAARYEDFLAKFRPSLDSLAMLGCADPGQMFELQTLLIHEYRRILLKSTDLPDALLPANWSGRSAMELTAQIYAYSAAPTAEFLASHLEGPQGFLPSAGKAYYARFS